MVQTDDSASLRDLEFFHVHQSNHRHWEFQRGQQRLLFIHQVGIVLTCLCKNASAQPVFELEDKKDDYKHLVSLETFFNRRSNYGVTSEGIDF